ncbi:MAG: 4Fe-4S dicluster domain-containing protein [Bacillota bacterium]
MLRGRQLVKARKIVSKKAFNSFIEELAERTKVVAPVEREDGAFSFEEVRDASTLRAHYIPSAGSAKKYFFPPEEVLLRFRSSADDGVHAGGDVQVTAEVESEDMVLLGVRPCDVAAINLMDRVFADTYEDENYLEKRARATVIGVNCLSPCDEHAFCAAMGSLDVTGGYDLMLTDLDDSWVIDVATDAGEKLLGECEGLRELRPEESERLQRVLSGRERDFEGARNRLDFPAEEIPQVLAEGEESPVWDEYGARCLGCGRCNLVCPTCFCFDVQDDVSLDLGEGERRRRWDACTLQDFALVACGENFRADRSERLRHMYYHKGKYAHERYGQLYCTGCGRCVRTCLMNIDPPTVYNEVRRRPSGEAE